MLLFGGIDQRSPPGDHGVEHGTGDGPLVGEGHGPRRPVGPEDDHRVGVVLEAGEWEVVGLLTGGHGEPQYRIRSPDQVRINVVAERDLPSRATAAALT